MTPLTGPQLRALHAEFRQLGYTRRSDRAERLAVAALALGLPRLGSFSDLSTGQAGYLLRLLREAGNDHPADDAAATADPAATPAARPAPARPHQHGTRAPANRTRSAGRGAQQPTDAIDRRQLDPRPA